MTALLAVVAVLIHYAEPMRVILAAILAVGVLPFLLLPAWLLLILLRERDSRATMGPTDLAAMYLIGVVFCVLWLPDWLFD
ncbi:MAG: hypothetical protein KY475_23900 [Planctomycetes bacterium]|nr:hypothetical protein [Planctomycetota bacterium]